MGGQYDPSVGTRDNGRITEALGIPLAQLLESTGESSVRVVRNGTAPQLVDPETMVAREALLEPQPGLEFIRYELPAHAITDRFPAGAARTRLLLLISRPLRQY